MAAEWKNSASSGHVVIRPFRACLQLVTAADYAVLVKGLDEGKQIDGEGGLEELFKKDLEKLGFGFATKVGKKVTKPAPAGSKPISVRPNPPAGISGPNL